MHSQRVIFCRFSSDTVFSNNFSPTVSSVDHRRALVFCTPLNYLLLLCGVPTCNNLQLRVVAPASIGMVTTNSCMPIGIYFLLFLTLLFLFWTCCIPLRFVINCSLPESPPLPVWKLITWAHRTCCCRCHLAMRIVSAILLPLTGSGVLRFPLAVPILITRAPTLLSGHFVI